MKKFLKYFAGIAAVLLFVGLGSFPALALQHSPVALVAAATTALAPFSLQLKLLAIGGSVYTILQVVKQVFPIAGLGAVILNIVLSALGVAVVIKPEDLFSLPTLTALVIAGLTAAGTHGTIKSFTGSGGTPPAGTGTATAAMLAIACLSMVMLTGCSSLEHQAYNAIVGAKAFTQSISAQHPECGTRDANGHWVPSASTAGVCVALGKGIAAKDVMIDAAEEYCAGPDFQTGGQCNPPTDKTLKDQLAAKVQAALQNYTQTEADIRSLIH